MNRPLKQQLPFTAAAAQFSCSHHDISFDLLVSDVWRALVNYVRSIRGHFDNSLQPLSQRKACKIFFFLFLKVVLWISNPFMWSLERHHVALIVPFTHKVSSCLATQKTVYCF